MRLYDYPASGNCYKVRLLLALLDRDCERVPVDIFAGETLTDEFARLNPARETPVLELDDGATIAQSNAILWFLARGTEYLPDDRLTQARIVQWLSFEQEWITRGLGAGRFLVLTQRSPDVARERLAHGRRALDLLEIGLQSSRFVLGASPTVADISLYAYTHVAADAGVDLDAWPLVQRWAQTIADLPGYMNDYVRYPHNAKPGRGRSIYDESWDAPPSPTFRSPR